ncbi:MAG: hypothetical protein TREMPRED_002408 [Tremellales sp. Tagirdzhanova-0007]|nr:MAG: hypothetical protein TREMPRED_002408 [Tremellales sp. Tagirdzhanova-0007]
MQEPSNLPNTEDTELKRAKLAKLFKDALATHRSGNSQYTDSPTQHEESRTQQTSHAASLTGNSNPPGKNKNKNKNKKNRPTKASSSRSDFKPEISIHQRQGNFFISTNVRDGRDTTYSGSETQAFDELPQTKNVTEAVRSADDFVKTPWHREDMEQVDQVAKLLSTQAAKYQTSLSQTLQGDDADKESRAHVLRQYLQGLQISAFKLWQGSSDITKKEWDISGLDPDILFPEDDPSQKVKTEEDRVSLIVGDLKRLWTGASFYPFHNVLQMLRDTLMGIQDVWDESEASLISPNTWNEATESMELEKQRVARVEAAYSYRFVESAKTNIATIRQLFKLPSYYPTWLNAELIRKVSEFKDPDALGKALKECVPKLEEESATQLEVRTNTNKYDKRRQRRREAKEGKRTIGSSNLSEVQDDKSEGPAESKEEDSARVQVSSAATGNSYGFQTFEKPSQIPKIITGHRMDHSTLWSRTRADQKDQAGGAMASDPEDYEQDESDDDYVSDETKQKQMRFGLRSPAQWQRSATQSFTQSGTVQRPVALSRVRVDESVISSESESE